MKTRTLSCLLAFFVISFLFISRCHLYAQVVTITDDDAYTPDNSAMLDVKSIDKGLLIPRLDSSQRVAISTPATGLLVFDTDANAFYYYDGSDWLNLTTNVISPASATVNDVLFSVINTNGDTVFAVYPEGVQINVGDGVGKAKKGGFAVGGLASGKLPQKQFLVVSPDSVRIYIDTTTGSKANKGGFAVGGLASGKSNGPTFFTVSDDSVRIYLDTVGAGKANKGGFAVGGLASGKGAITNLLTVSQDSVRIYFDESDSKANKGGFAVGGLASGKATGTSYLIVSDDSVRVFIDTTTGTKANKGGFAVGGLASGKATGSTLFTVSDDSIRVYIDQGASKANKGGFAVGGLASGKAGSAEYMKISSNTSADTINPSEARFLWYPTKEAFLVGRVLIESVDSVGTNSMVTGYQSKSIGDYSQAFGYEAIARGDYSTAIGYQAIANDTNSFAFGQWAQADSMECYAFGRGAKAEGFRSFAFGSAGVDSAGDVTGVARAIGDYSFAIGQGSVSEGVGAFAMGIADTARGKYSTALGYGTIASGVSSTAMGKNTTASVFSSTAMGYKTIASAHYSTAMGFRTTASGAYSTAMGSGTTASENYSTAMGGGTIASGQFSTAMGGSTIASGNNSTAMGYETTASGDYSIARGFGTTASGFSSTAIGCETTASGKNSTAMGFQTTARAYSSFVIGRYNDTITTSSLTSWIDTDPLFIIGNGTIGARNNAVTVLKNGNVGIGSTKFPPTEMLDVEGNTRIDGEIRQGSTDYGAYEIQTGGKIYTNDYLVAMGGIHVGGTSDPGTDNLVVEGGVHVGGAYDPGTDNLMVDGNIGIGATPIEKLIVKMGSGTGWAAPHFALGAYATTNTWDFLNNGTDLYIGYNEVSQIIIKSNGDFCPKTHKGSDIGQNGLAWDDIYYDDLINQGSAAFNDRNVTEEIVLHPPKPKIPGMFDYKTDRGLEELDPASLPVDLTDGQMYILTDEMTTYNYKANYEQQLQIEKLKKENEELKNRLNEIEEILKKE